VLTDDRTDEEPAQPAPLSIAWHVTSSVNRASILEHGLDWRWMETTGGVASGLVSQGPEMEAVFFCESLDEAEFFIGLGTHPRFDVWRVDVAGLRLEPGPDGWVIHRRPIEVERLQLVRQDVSLSPPTPKPPAANARADDQVVFRDELRITPAEEP
jgi:hypothetical protein